MKIPKQLTFMRLGLVALMAATLAGCGGGGGGGGGGTVTPPPSSTADPALVAQARPEQCVLCHTDTPTGNNGSFGSVANTGPKHFANYTKYTDASKFTLTIDSVVTAAGTSTLTFTAKNNGACFTAQELADMTTAKGGQHTFYAVPYDDTTRTFGTSFSYTATAAGDFTTVGAPANCQYSVKKTSAPFAPESTNAEVYAYIARGLLDTEGMALYDDVANAGHAYGTAATYASAANVSACETCHGKPYMKHGYRMAQVSNNNGADTSMQDFGACKNCHYDNRDGHDLNWQIMKDDPLRAAAIAAGSPIDATETAKYAYKARIMNDVHMSHNMEFPYPQTMQSCTTCHAGKMGDTAANDIFADDKFKPETCVSCHSVDGLKAKMTNGGAITIHDSFLAQMDTYASRAALAPGFCTTCHGKAIGIGPTFATIHKGGYDPKIYATNGTRYSDNILVSVDTATYDAATHMLDITFSAAGTVGSLNAVNIKPTILIGLYGYDTKDFIVAAHGSAADGKRNLEHVWGDGNPRFTDVSASPAGTWHVKADLSLWADKLAADTDGLVVIRRAEIAVLPELKDASGTVLGLNAPSKTFNFAANSGAGAFETYFPDLVNVFKTANANTNGSLDGCNTCHDQLATTFHSGIRGGNIKVCRICHEVSNGGSHLEAQSRSIDSYVHAIHSFQAFDPGDIDYTNDLEVFEYEEHISHHFPRFTIKDCEACHVNSTNVYASGRRAYDVPNQSKSMPGVLSGTDTIDGRDIGPVSPAVTGPAVRACGACHRAQAINADDEGRLSTQIAHWQTFGYYIEVASADARTLWDAVVAKMMALFRNEH